MPDNAGYKGPQPEGQFEQITDEAQIIGLLRRAQDARLLLSVNLPNDEHFFNSAVLDVSAEERHLLLDALHPDTGHRQVSVGTPLHVFARLQGVEMSFTGTVEQVGNASGGAFYRLALPGKVFYLQRREHYRVRVGVSQEIPVSLPVDEAKPIKGELFDLSAGGICVRLRRPAPAPTIGLRVEHCQIALPDGAPLDCTLEVRNVREDPQSGGQYLGLSFVDLGRREQQRLQRFVTSLDREMRKRAKRVSP